MLNLECPLSFVSLAALVQHRAPEINPLVAMAKPTSNTPAPAAIPSSRHALMWTAKRTALFTGNGLPRGRTRAWFVVLGSWLASFSGLGLSNNMATLQAYISTHQLKDYNEW